MTARERAAVGSGPGPTVAASNASAARFESGDGDGIAESGAVAFGAAPLDQSRLGALTGYRLKRAYLVVQQRSAAEFARFGITGAEFAVMVLIDANRHVTQKRLCDALAVSPPNMVGLLDRLKQRGWIARSRDEADRRTWLLRATPAGAKLVRQVERNMLDFERETLLAGFSMAQIDALRQLLARF